MSLEQNENLSTLLKKPFNALNNDAWSKLLTSRENALLSSRESLSIQDSLFNKVYRAYDIAYKKFMIHNPQLDEVEKAELTETHTNSQNVKNSKPTLNSELTPLQNAQAQIQELEALAATSPDPDILSKLPQVSIQLAENAHKVKEQLFAEAAPEAVVLQKIQMALDKLIEKPTAPASAPTAPPDQGGSVTTNAIATGITAIVPGSNSGSGAPTASPAESGAPPAQPTAPPAITIAPGAQQGFAPGYIAPGVQLQEAPQQGGRRLRKSRRRTGNQKKKTLRRSKR